MGAATTDRHISLLRGVNVGGKTIVKMAWLRAAYESISCEDVATYLQSGNVVFRRDRAPQDVAAEIEQVLTKEFDFTTKILDRTHADLQVLLDEEPFPDVDPSRRLVVFLSRPLKKPEIEALEKLPTGSEALFVGARELHLSCPDGIGRSKLAAAVGKTRLDLVATARNWRTLTKLAEMSAPSDLH